MNEKQKMLNGYIYKPFMDDGLTQDRFSAKTLCFEFNNTPPAELEKRKLIIKKIFGKTKENFHIESNFYCDYGYNIEIGENFYVNHNCVILDCAKVKFGDNVFIAPNCGFYTAGHPLDKEMRIGGEEFAYPITVGNNVWIGGHVCVMPGVTIGDDTVIGAGSVVTKNIPSGVVAVGNPCRVLREITQDDINNYKRYN